jgi:hypothetical protein
MGRLSPCLAAAEGVLIMTILGRQEQHALPMDMGMARNPVVVFRRPLMPNPTRPPLRAPHSGELRAVAAALPAVPRHAPSPGDGQ